MPYIHADAVTCGVTPQRSDQVPLLQRLLRRTRDDVAGAVTVDFVVIMASIVVMGTIIVAMTREGQEKIAGDINVALSAVPVN